jgi:phosphoglycolate phosphatase-like HAD superfamily hydrolase
MWYNSFNPYLERISKEFNVDIESLKKDFKNIHKNYGTTEASFIYEELACLTQSQKLNFNKESLLSKSILHEYYSNKKNNLILYESVLDTLKRIKASGAMIVGFTESNAFFTKYRIKTLNLDGILDCVYSPIDTGVPSNVYKHYSEDHWEPSITEIRYLPKATRKPNSEILEVILKDFGANKQDSIYIGDKLDRDIFMAQQASVTSVYAKYGHVIDTHQYELLRDVTHWTDEDVKREIDFKEKFHANPKPDYILTDSFSELNNYFNFNPFDKVNKSEKIENVISIWEKVIDVQQHFNDIELKIRNLALTVFTFIIGGIGFLEKENIKLMINGYTIQASAALAFIGIFIIYAFLFMDRFWYHKLLLGAVKHGMFTKSCMI